MEPDSSTTAFSFNNTEYLVYLEQVFKIANRIQSLLGVDAFELSIDFVSEEQIKALNTTYRHRNSSTDILSFPQQMWDYPLTVQLPYSSTTQQEIPQLLGDLVISLSDAHKNSQQIGQGLDRELCFLLIHGILHLCGHDHVTPQEESIMLEQQQIILTQLQGDPPPIWENCVRSKS